MATLAPAVSQVLASHHRLSDALTTYCSADVEAATSAHDGNPAHPAAGHWQVCPYCSLIAHVPTLPGSVVAFAVPLAAGPMSSTVASMVVRANVVHTVAQPRAPPVFS